MNQPLRRKGPQPSESNEDFVKREAENLREIERRRQVLKNIRAQIEKRFGKQE